MSVPSHPQTPPAPDPLGRSADAERYAHLLTEATRIKGVSLGRDAWRRLRRDSVSMIALGFLALVAGASILTPVLPLQSPIRQSLGERQFNAPSTEPVSLGLVDSVGTSDFEPLVNELWYQPGVVSVALIRVRLLLFGDWCVPSICGTDNLGRDLLARLFWGSRVSLIVGIVATLVSLLIGVSYGAIAGYVGGLVDSVMMRVVDILYSIPFIFVVIYLITALGDDEGGEASWKARLESVGINQITLFYIVIGAIYWLTMARVVRGQVISLKHEQFIEAARTIGASSRRIIFRHLIPNVLSVVIVYLTLTIPSVMLFEAFLSFLGLGVSAPDVSWGLLANEGIKFITPIRIYWWLVLFPGLALGLTLLALNFLGDGLRDALDPRMKNR